MRTWLSLCLNCLLLTASLALTSAAAEDDQDISQDTGEAAAASGGPADEIIQQKIEEALKKVLAKYEGLHIPAIPPINVDMGEQISLSLSLTNINLQGISNVKVHQFVHTGGVLVGHNQTFQMSFPAVSLNIGNYVAGGHMINVPFNGEGPMSVTLYDLNIKLDFSWDKYTIIYAGSCVMDNSTKYDLDLPRMRVQMDNLNEGSDQGQLVNIVLSSFGPDIVDKLEILLNTSLYPVIDDALVQGLNQALNCPDVENIVLLDTADANLMIEDLLFSLLGLQDTD